jgi:hypothetical protein
MKEVVIGRKEIEGGKSSFQTFHRLEDFEFLLKAQSMKRWMRRKRKKKRKRKRKMRRRMKRIKRKQKKRVAKSWRLEKRKSWRVEKMSRGSQWEEM